MFNWFRKKKEPRQGITVHAVGLSREIFELGLGDTMNIDFNGKKVRLLISRIGENELYPSHVSHLLTFGSKNKFH